MIFVFLSGVAGALFGMSYKIRAELRLDYRSVLFFGGAWSTLVSAGMALLLHEPLYTPTALLIGLPYGATLTLSMVIYFRVVERMKLGLSWTFIQMSVVIPFALSVAAYGEQISWREAGGVVLIFATILLLGIAKPKPSRTDEGSTRALGGLFLTFLLTGLTQCFPKIYQALPGTHPTATVLFYASVGMLISAAAIPRSQDDRSAEQPTSRRRNARRPLHAVILFSLYMSVARLAVPLFLLLALHTVRGAIVFPMRTMINILLVATVSFLVYRERLGAFEAVGIPVAIVAITLLSI